jgi:hypothetical protein
VNPSAETICVATPAVLICPSTLANQFSRLILRSHRQGCGGVIAAGRAADVVKGVRPFDDLRSELRIPADEVEEDINQAPDEQRLPMIATNIIRELIRSLDSAVEREPTPWKELARRESRHLLGRRT